VFHGAGEASGKRRCLVDALIRIRSKSATTSNEVVP
jgi:hypothetical protein